MTKQDKCRELYEREVGTLKEQEWLTYLKRSTFSQEPAEHPYFKVSNSAKIKTKIRNKRRNKK